MNITLDKFDFESNKILSSLPESERNYFLASCDVLNFKKGQLLFFEKGVPTGVFLIEKGSAKIFKTGPDAKDQVFYVYKEGDLLGYHALVCNENYEDSCETLESCRIRFLRKELFEKMMVEIPLLQKLLIQNMGHEFGVLVNQITILAQKPLRERLALYLLILDRRFSSREAKAEIKIPREDLANMIGTARESLGRLLKEFKEDQLIDISVKSIRILKPEKLKDIANSHYSRA